MMWNSWQMFCQKRPRTSLFISGLVNQELPPQSVSLIGVTKAWLVRKKGKRYTSYFYISMYSIKRKHSLVIWCMLGGHILASAIGIPLPDANKWSLDHPTQDRYRSTYNCINTFPYLQNNGQWPYPRYATKRAKQEARTQWKVFNSWWFQYVYIKINVFTSI